MVLEITQLSPNSVQITLDFVDQASPVLPTDERNWFQKALGIDGASQLFAPIFLASSLIITEYL